MYWLVFLSIVDLGIIPFHISESVKFAISILCFSTYMYMHVEKLCTK